MTSNENKQENEVKQEKNQPTTTDSNKNWLKNFVDENKEMIIFVLLVVMVFIIIIIGLYTGSGALLESLKYTEVARGLITFLVTLTTVSIAILLALYALCSSLVGDDLKERFGFGMQILTALIGILGTVLGFYFATLQQKPVVSEAAKVVAATPVDAQDLVKKAVEFYKVMGKEKALAEFNNLKGQFVQDQLFIFVLDLDGNFLAHPKANFVGRDFLKEKDAEAKALSEAIVNQAREKGSGQVDFTWQDPQTGKVESKVFYFEKVGDIIICSDTYKK